MSLSITVLIENYAPVSLGLYAEHGLSMLVKYNEKSYLFDTGQSGAALDNAFVLKQNINVIDSVILSHGHYDHTGGLLRFLKYLNREIDIMVHPKAFEEKFVIGAGFGKKYIGLLNSKDYLENNFNASFKKLSDFEKIDDGVYTLACVPFTNDIEKIPEALKVKKGDKFVSDTFEDDLSLIIDTDKGLVILLGCAHRGMVNICTEAMNKLGKNIYAIIGGTHTGNADEKHLEFITDFLLDNEVKIFAPNHCTGFDKINYFRNKLPDIFYPAFTGSILEL